MSPSRPVLRSVAGSIGLFLLASLVLVGCAMPRAARRPATTATPEATTRSAVHLARPTTERTPRPPAAIRVREISGYADALSTELRPRLALSFSADVLTETVLANLRVLPAIPFTTTWRSPRELLVQPARDLRPGEALTLRLGGGRGASGAPLPTRAWRFATKPLMELTSWPTTFVEPAALAIRVNYPIRPERMVHALRLDPPLAGKWWSDPGSGRIVFTPGEPWPDDTRFRVTLSGPVIDDRGRMLHRSAEPGAPLGRGPLLTFTSPRAAAFGEAAAEAQDQSVLQPVVVHFGRQVDPDSLHAALAITPALRLAATWDGNKAALLPESGYFAPRTAYTLTLGTSLRDAAGGELLRRPITGSFQTGDAVRLVSFGGDADTQVLDTAGRRAVEVVAMTPIQPAVSVSLHRLPVERLVAPVETGQPPSGPPQAELTAGQPIAAWSLQMGPALTGPTGRPELRLPADLPPGAYRLTISAGGISSSLTTLLASHRLVVKRAAGQLGVWATEAGGAPAGNLGLSVYDRTGQLLAAGVTDAAGGAQVAVPRASRPAWIVADGDGIFAALELASDWLSYRPAGGAGDPDLAPPPFSGLVYTDRLIYRPGQQLHFKGILRGDLDGELVLPARGEPVTVRLKDPRGNTVQTWQLTPNDFGTVAGEMVIAEGAPLGDYRLTMAAGEDSFGATFGVEDYVAPDMEVLGKILGVPAKGAIQVEGAVRYRFGQPAAGAEVRVQPIALQRDVYALDASIAGWALPDIEPLPVRTDGDGRFRFELPPDLAARVVDYSREGWYSGIGGAGTPVLGFEITADDGAGPIVSQLVTATLPAAPLARSTSTPAPPVAGAEALRITANRARFRPGETARLLVQSPVAGPALLTVERGRLRSRRVVELTPPWTEVALAISAADAPNVFLSVHQWQPDPAPTTNESTADGRLAMATLEIPVDVVGKDLRVGVTASPARLAPGATTRLTVRVRDDQGRPAAAEISLAVVDEAVLALRRMPPAALLPPFYSRRPHELVTFDVMAPRRDLSVLATPAPHGPRTGGGDGGPSYGEPRTDFQDTALWRADLVTDALGEVTVDVPLPDNLTRWRVVAIAITRDTRLGQGEATVETTQPLVLQPLLPRFLVQGDELSLAAAVQNLGDGEAQAETGLQAGGLALTEPLTRTVPVAAHARATITWAVRADLPGTAEITLRSSAGEAFDALRLALPIRALAVPERATSVGSFGREATVAFRRPEDALPDGDISVRLSRSLGGTVLQGLDDLTGFPYGCVEQTLSKALPNAVVAQAGERLGLTDTGAREQLARLVPLGVQRLYGFQHDDGGWGWWQDDPTDDYQTAWVLYGLGVTRAGGFEVDPAVIERGAAYLRGRLDQADPRTRAFALYALAGAGHPVTTTAKALAADPDELDPFSQAALALALHGQGDAELAGRALNRLLKGLKTEGQQSWWPVGVADGTYANKTMASDVRSTALGLSAVLALRPSHPAVPRIARWLTAQRQGQGWGTTNETAFTVLALVDYLARSPEAVTAAGYTVYLNDRQVAAGRLGPGALTAEVAIPAGELPAGTNRVRLVQDGDKPLHYVVQRDFQLPRASIAAAGPVAVRRSWRQADGQAVTEVQRGETLTVTLSLRLPEPASYLLIEDFLPAGLEALNPRLDTTSALAAPVEAGLPAAPETEGAANHVEIRADRVSLFVTEVPAGTTELRYLARATRPGRFTALPAEVAAMYDPATWGRSASATFEVR